MEGSPRGVLVNKDSHPIKNCAKEDFPNEFGRLQEKVPFSVKEKTSGNPEWIQTVREERALNKAWLALCS